MRLIFRFLIILGISIPLLGQERLTLEDCIRIAMKKNSDIRIAEQQARSAVAGMSASYNEVLPTVSMSAFQSHSVQAPSEYVFQGRVWEVPASTQDYYRVGLSVNQNIYNGGKGINTIKIGKTSLEISKYNMDYYRQVIATNVIQRYFEVLKAQQLLLAYQKAFESSQSRVGKTEQMFRVGSIAQTDLYKAKVQEGNDRLNVLRQQTAVQLALSNLNLAMGLPANNPLEIVEDIDLNLPDMEYEVTKKTALFNNPDIRKQEKQIRLKQLSYKSALGDYMPNVNLGFNYSRTNPKLSKLYTDVDRYWNWSLDLSLGYNLFNGLRRKAAVEQKWLDYRMAEEELEKKKLTLIRDVENYLLALQTYKEMIKINELNLQSAKEDLKLAEERYRLKSATFLEVLDAQSKLTQAEQSLISAKYDAKITEAQLQLLMGSVNIPE